MKNIILISFYLIPLVYNYMAIRKQLKSGDLYLEGDHNVVLLFVVFVPGFNLVCFAIRAGNDAAKIWKPIDRLVTKICKAVFRV